jgi:hypothetical protein
MQFLFLVGLNLLCRAYLRDRKWSQSLEHAATIVGGSLGRYSQLRIQRTRRDVDFTGSVQRIHQWCSLRSPMFGQLIWIFYHERQWFPVVIRTWSVLLLARTAFGLFFIALYFISWCSLIMTAASPPYLDLSLSTSTTFTSLSHFRRLSSILHQ